MASDDTRVTALEGEIAELKYLLSDEQRRLADVAKRAFALKTENRTLRRQIAKLADLAKVKAARRSAAPFAERPTEREWREIQKSAVIRAADGDVDAHPIR